MRCGHVCVCAALANCRHNLARLRKILHKLAIAKLEDSIHVWSDWSKWTYLYYWTGTAYTHIKSQLRLTKRHSNSGKIS